MAEIIRAERRADGAVAVTVREESQVVIAAADAKKKDADLHSLAKAGHAADKLTKAEALVAAKKGGKS